MDGVKGFITSPDGFQQILFRLTRSGKGIGLREIFAGFGVNDALDGQVNARGPGEFVVRWGYLPVGVAVGPYFDRYGRVGAF